MVKAGEKFEYVGEKTDYYTPGKVYAVTGGKRDFDFRFSMTDDRGGGHWWSDEAMKEKFKTVQKGPIREVRRREIAPGVYGIVHVTSRETISIVNKCHTPEQLREASHLLAQIAEVLEDSNG